MFVGREDLLEGGGARGVVNIKKAACVSRGGKAARIRRRSARFAKHRTPNSS